MSDSYTDVREITEELLVDTFGYGDKPSGCNFDITARCNNDCRHCCICVHPDDSHAKSLELSAEEIDAIADEAVAMGVMYTKISGGEPLLRSDFSDIYLRLKRKGLLVSVFTNATLVTNDHVQLFRKYPPSDIEVTVYGVTQSTYERVTRVPGTFDAFMRGLNLLLDGGVKVRLKAMVLHSNIHELGRIAEFCRARTKDYFRFDPWLQLRHDGDQARNELIRSERLSAEEFVAVEMSDTERCEALVKKCNEVAVHQASANTHRNGLLFYCGAGVIDYTITQEGFFQLCPSLAHPECVYDLRKGSLTEAYRSLVPKVRAMRSRRSEFLKRCGHCSIIRFCSWCPGHNYQETGELDTPVDYFCQVAHARIASVQATLSQ